MEVGGWPARSRFASCGMPVLCTGMVRRASSRCAGTLHMMPEPEPRKRLRRFEVTRRARALNFSCFRGQRFLASDRSCRWLADSLTVGLDKHEIDLWAYCFMPTHIHLLVFPRFDRPSIAAFLESVKTSVAK